MKCEEYVSGYCMQAIKYKKYAKIRRCDKCCLGCMEPCGNICKIALEINEEKAYK